MTALTPVVLLHGWGGSYKSTWAENEWPAAFEAAGRSVWPTDLPGHGGRAPADPEAYGDLVGVLDTRLPEGVLDIVGFSLGGKLALAIAAQQPGRVRRLVIGGVGDNLFSAEPSGEAVADALVRGVREDAPPAVAALVDYARRGENDPAALAAVLRRSPNPILAEADLDSVSEVLLANGEEDKLATPDARLVRALPRSRLVRLCGVDHLSLPSSRAFRDLAVKHLTESADMNVELL